MADQHLQLHSSGHLRLHSSGHLKLWSNPVWHAASLTSTGWSGYNNFNPTSTKTNINLDPLTTAYPTAKTAALSSFASGSYLTTSCSAAVGAPYDRGGAARSSVAVGGMVYSFTPASVSSAARIALSAECMVGVFNSAPSAGQILGASGFTPVGGYVDLEIFLDIINACAEAASTCYVSTCRPPPNTLTGTIDQLSFYNDYGEDILLWDWCPVSDGETLYWKVGTVDVTLPLSSGGVDLYY